MSNSLRASLIRLAHENPKFRPALLPLLKEAAWAREASVSLGPEAGGLIAAVRRYADSPSAAAAEALELALDDYDARLLSDQAILKKHQEVVSDARQLVNRALGPNPSAADFDALAAVARWHVFTRA